MESFCALPAVVPSQAADYSQSMPEQFGKMLVLLGVVLTLTGLVLWSGVGKAWLGRLPGDINISRGNFSFHFPLVTCLVISVILTLLAFLFRK